LILADAIFNKEDFRAMAEFDTIPDNPYASCAFSLIGTEGQTPEGALGKRRA
jgi:hypothetical protein